MIQESYLDKRCDRKKDVVCVFDKDKIREDKILFWTKFEDRVKYVEIHI